MAVLQTISSLFIPVMIGVILIHGFIKGVNLYDAFIEGAVGGLKTATKILPYLVAIFVAIGFLRRSGAMAMLVGLFFPVTQPLGIPSEVLPLVLMRPFSGSGSLGILQDILTTYGPDSYVGRVASTMMSSAETIFFTMTLYFGAIGVQKPRYTVPAALLSHLGAVMASVIVCRMIF